MGKKVLYSKIFLTEKTFTEKNINENVKIYISFEKYIFMQKMFVLQIKEAPNLWYSLNKLFPKHKRTS